MTAADYFKFLFALLFVLSLMGGLAYVLKRLGYGGRAVRTTKERRMEILEILPLDARRRAILLRRDDTEHLVILGATGETVVETNIIYKPESAPSHE